jgi:hypothetical protein
LFNCLLNNIFSFYTIKTGVSDVETYTMLIDAVIV